MATSVNVFVADRDFINPATAFLPVLDTGGVGRLTQNGLSYFVNLTTLPDKREASARTVDWVAEYTPVILADAYFYNDFITAVNALSDTQRASLFEVVDALLYKTHTAAALETYLTTTDGVKDLYVAGSLVLPTVTVSDLVYTSTGSSGTEITTHPVVTAELAIPSGTTTINFTVSFFNQDAYWISHYPSTEIEAVAPPLSYSDLLNLPLTTATANKLATSATTVALSIGAIATPLQAKTASGYLQYNVTVVDSANNNQVLAPFTILYKGASPSQQEIREAIKSAVMNSGTGTEDQWKTRIPELFILATIYLIPMYDNVTELSDQHLYPSTINMGIVAKKIALVLPTLGTTYITANAELVPANYEKLLLACIGSPETDGTAPNSLLAMHPTYQWSATTDATFQNMNTDTQEFVLMLSECLTVATGNGTSPLYQIETDQNLKYVSFVSLQYEYCVITKACYSEIIAEAG